jgi:hypothetical protein
VVQVSRHYADDRWWICGNEVDLKPCNIDEYGMAVHADRCLGEVAFATESMRCMARKSTAILQNKACYRHAFSVAWKCQLLTFPPSPPGRRSLARLMTIEAGGHFMARYPNLPFKAFRRTVELDPWESESPMSSPDRAHEVLSKPDFLRKMNAHKAIAIAQKESAIQMMQDARKMFQGAINLKKWLQWLAARQTIVRTSQKARGLSHAFVEVPANTRRTAANFNSVPYSGWFVFFRDMSSADW